MLLLISCSPKENSSSTSPRFNHVFLSVSNLERSVAFYKTAFDIELTNELRHLKRTEASAEVLEYDVKIALLKFPGQNFVLEVGERLNFEAANDNANYAHLGIEVKDIEAAKDQLLNAGAQLDRPIALVETDGIKAKNAFFIGPDGETIELMQIITGDF